jgi:hypothetical protein
MADEFTHARLLQVGLLKFSYNIALSILKITWTMEKNYRIPAIVWLRVTDFMHGWLQHELGGACRIKEQRVISVQHLPGARDLLKMETTEDVELKLIKIGNCMSGNRKNMLEAGLSMNADYIKQEYGLTWDDLRQFVPIECPRMCLTRFGVLRPWTLDVNLGKQQASELLRLIRTAFWTAVEEFNQEYAHRTGNTKYPSINMVEAFCKETGTPDSYTDAITREWNRRVKRGDNRK